MNKSIAVGVGTWRNIRIRVRRFESEPPDPASPLFQCENYIATPHIAGETYENRERTGLATANAFD